MTLHFTQSDNILKKLDNQLFVSVMLIRNRSILEQEPGSSLIKGLQVP